MLTELQFSTYYKTYYKSLVFAGIRLTKNHSEAEDLVQEAMLKAYKALHTFEIGTSFENWVYIILRNTYINKYNQKKRRREISQSADFLRFVTSFSSLVINEAESNLGAQTIIKTVDKLNDTSRIPFNLYVDGFSYEEIASKLCIPLGTVKSRINFARTKLRENKILQEQRA